MHVHDIASAASTRHTYSAQHTWYVLPSCFANPTLLQVLPVERGAGLQQPGIAAAEDLLRSGSWVHIFPEGTRSRDGKLQPCRKGVGRLVASCDVPPVVVPFVHKGMDDVMAKYVVNAHDLGAQVIRLNCTRLYISPMHSYQCPYNTGAPRSQCQGNLWKLLWVHLCKWMICCCVQQPSSGATICCIAG